MEELNAITETNETAPISNEFLSDMMGMFGNIKEMLEKVASAPVGSSVTSDPKKTMEAVQNVLKQTGFLDNIQDLISKVDDKSISDNDYTGMVVGAGESFTSKINSSLNYGFKLKELVKKDETIETIYASDEFLHNFRQVENISGIFGIEEYKEFIDRLIDIGNPIAWKFEFPLQRKYLDVLNLCKRNNGIEGIMGTYVILILINDKRYTELWDKVGCRSNPQLKDKMELYIGVEKVPVLPHTPIEITKL
jgi:ribosomal protein S8